MANLVGTSGNDTIVGTDDDDLIDAGGGNDHVEGRGGNDTIYGGAGDDDLFGGDGDDLIYGGDGDDIITGNAGSDTLIGGTGNDIFYGVTPGDVIDGGEGYDRIIFDRSFPEGWRYEVEYDPDNLMNGTIHFFDEDDTPQGMATFVNIDKVDGAPITPPCFTPGTMIATPSGERAIETLKAGDKVLTRDNGIREIRWTGARQMNPMELSRHAHLRPIHIRQGALGNDLPERNMMVSPNHRMLVSSDKTALYFEESEVLVAAKYLTGLDGVSVAGVPVITYIHIMFDQHEIILSDGCWTESFQPGDQSLAGIGNAQRQELFELFPELENIDNVGAFGAARRILKKHEAQLLTR